jgi:hypothetical protein
MIFIWNICMPARKMPKPWKTAKSRRGFYYQPFGRGHMLFDPDHSVWFYSLPRGTTDTADHWGPFKGPLTDIDRVSKEMQALEASVEKAGWFKMKSVFHENSGHPYTNVSKEEMDKASQKLPRSTLVPSYFLVPADAKRAAAGKARKKDVLQIGGHDICRDNRRDWWTPDVSSFLELSIREPGEKRYSPSTQRLHLDAASVDALIAFLLDMRRGMVSKDAEQDAFQAVLGNRGDGDMHERFYQGVTVSREISALLAELRQAKPDEISTIRMMTQMLRTKEMDVELIYDEDGEVRIGAIH